MEQETLVLWLALVAYVVSGVTAIIALVFRKKPERFILAALSAGLVLHTLSIGLRWERLGHGPFVTMFEILSSNIWSLTLVFALVYWRIKLIRPIAAVVMPLLFIMMGWILLVSPEPGHFPPTYDTIWLYIHIGFGKIFLGAAIVAVGLGCIILLRRLDGMRPYFERLPNNTSLDELAYRFIAVGLIFDSLMLIAGAIWAQDAWGRYWDWDPLETWSFITWLLLALSIHFRITLKPKPEWGAIIIICTFLVAFLTFFGIPFISEAPHKGAI